MLIKACEQDAMKIHAMNFEYTFEYFHPANSCDQWGLKTVYYTLLQFVNHMKVHFYFNVQDKLKLIPRD
jgi:hypothetical protein